MTQIILEGKSHRGKKLISKLGPLWEIHAKTDKVLFNSEVGPWLYIAPFGKTYLSKDARWIKECNDIDFTIGVQ